MQGITNTVALVTGAASGIGRATAERFADEGAQVVVADVVDDGGTETVELIENDGGDAVFVHTDVTNADDIQAMVDTALDTYGQLDFAVNNAGIEGTSAPTTELTEDDWHRVIDINLKGVWLGMKHEIPAILDTDGGAIVNTSSVAGYNGFPDLAPYVASKHGVIGLTKTAALEYSAQGVRVNAVAPGVINTPMVSRTFEDDPEGLEQVLGAEPIGRLGEPEEIASAIVYLCSDDASFVTGFPMAVDGGYIAQ